MRILHLAKKYYPMIGGDAYVVYNLKEQQTKSGHTVYVLTSNCDEIVQDEEVLKFGLKDSSAKLDKITPQRLMSLLFLFLWGFKKVGMLKPDLIHSHSADMGFFISFAAKFYRIPLINTCHGISFNDKQYSTIKRKAEKFFLRYSGFKRIIAVDENGLRILKSAKFDNGVYIPNGVDIHKFERKHFEKNSKKIRFLFVGRLEKQKGIDDLIKATYLLKNNITKRNNNNSNNNNNIKNNSFEVIIVGEGKEKNNLLNLARDMDVQNLFTFTGKVSEHNLVDYYLKSDIFILPSLWEGLPLTLMEAAAAGLPIIATDVGGVSSIFVHGKNALILKAGEPEELAEKMQFLITNENIRENLGRNALDLAKKYSWENSEKKLAEVYKTVINLRE